MIEIMYINDELKIIEGGNEKTSIIKRLFSVIMTVVFAAGVLFNPLSLSGDKNNVRMKSTETVGFLVIGSSSCHIAMTRT
ncbi:hypothetical protein [Paenibacillus sp. FSL H7-0331]|uniref:hypothetical protein n=1 Tax=Paenibacillus sp. FSL H7-0331 TaxID=1920421 RepID=UPI0015C3594D|nr:hypothetical protein [Paenibacillus sp. FSL H7-0331]